MGGTIVPKGVRRVEVKLRKCETTLVNAGGGVILLAVWNVIKSIMLSISDNGEFLQVSTSTSTDFTSRVITVVSWIIGTAAVLCVQIYIGRRAIAEGRGKKRGSGYLILAGIGIAAEICGSIFIAFWIFSQGMGKEVIPDFAAALRMFISLIVELTWIYMFILLIVSAVRLRRIRKKVLSTGA